MSGAILVCWGHYFEESDDMVSGDMAYRNGLSSQSQRSGSRDSLPYFGWSIGKRGPATVRTRCAGRPRVECQHVGDPLAGVLLCQRVVVRRQQAAVERVAQFVEPGIVEVM